MKPFTMNILGDLVATNELSAPQALWHICDICIKKNSYTNWTLLDIRRLFMTPSEYGNYIVVFEVVKNERVAVAFCTWAWVDDKVDAGIRNSYLDPQRSEWQSGANLWIIDFVSPAKYTHVIIRFLIKSVFINCPTSHAYSLKRDKGGIVQKIGKWALRH